MKVFFLCQTGRHTSLLAGFMCLNKIEEINLDFDIVSLNALREKNQKLLGCPFYIGSSGGVDYYSIGVGRHGALFEKITLDLLIIMGFSPEKIKVLDMSDYVTMHTFIAILVNRIGLEKLGNLIWDLGLRREAKLLNSKLNKHGVAK